MVKRSPRQSLNGTDAGAMIALLFAGVMISRHPAQKKGPDVPDHDFHNDYKSDRVEASHTRSFLNGAAPACNHYLEGDRTWESRYWNTVYRQELKRRFPFTAGHEHFQETWAQAVADVLDRTKYGLECELDELLQKSESPIESLFLTALLAETRSMYHAYAAFTPQVQIGPYRVDVLIEWWDAEFENPTPRGEVVVELDGHEFHERTKQQAQRDKARDRYLAKENYRVVRFTGSEVWADPFKCVREAYDIAQTAFYELQGMRIAR